MKDDEILIGYVVKARVRFFFTLVAIEGFLAVVGVIALASTFYWRSTVEPGVLAAFISMTSGIIGSLTTILMAAINTSGKVTIRDGKVMIEPIAGEEKKEEQL